MKTSLYLLGFILLMYPSAHAQEGTHPHVPDSLFSQTNIEFISSGLKVRGWLYTPEKTKDTLFPVIIMAPGFAGVKECNYQYYAEHFSKEGFAVLLFDYPNFGASESRVAQEVDPWLQVQSYRDAISYATSLTFIDDNRVGLWGGSYSGGHAIVVAALDSRVKCFVTMTPFISGSAISAHLPTPIRDNYIFQFNTDRGKRMQGAGPMMIPVVSKGNSVFCAIRSTSAWNFVENFRPYAPAFQNGVTLKSIEMEFEYEPGSYIEQAGNKPKLFLLATADELMPETQILDIYNKAYEPKELKYIEGNHFSPYMEKLDAACDLAIQFFKKYLSRS